MCASAGLLFLRYRIIRRSHLIFLRTRLTCRYLSALAKASSTPTRTCASPPSFTSSRRFLLTVGVGRTGFLFSVVPKKKQIPSPRAIDGCALGLASTSGTTDVGNRKSVLRVLFC